MRYAFQLRAHSNARYQESLLTLSVKELRCMLHACGVEAEVLSLTLGGAPFLCFDTDELETEKLSFLCRHSGLYMLCLLREDGLLQPLNLPFSTGFPSGMPDVLKYKGKTNSDFTRLLINLALSCSSNPFEAHKCLLDPVCGHGTGLFCALESGMDAIGIDCDDTSLTEGVQFTKRFFQYNKLGYSEQRLSMTLPQGKSAAAECYTLKPPFTQTIRFIRADTAMAALLTKKTRADLLIADLPYGVQHAPSHGKGIDTL